jgi:hypothetical protein
VNASLFQIQAAARSPLGGISELSMNAALAMIEAAAPKDEIEAALAVQMAACHVAAMAVLAKMDVAFATERRVAAFGSAAARLMRAYATQVEVLRRLRSGGQQYVRVEHVHVNDGGPGCHRQCEKVGYSHFQLMRSAAAALAWGHHNCNRHPEANRFLRRDCIAPPCRGKPQRDAVRNARAPGLRYSRGLPPAFPRPALSQRKW